MDGTDFTNWLIVIIATAYKNFISLEGSLLPLWKFRYVEGGEEEEEGDGTGKKEPLEITSLRWPLYFSPFFFYFTSIFPCKFRSKITTPENGASGNNLPQVAALSNDLHFDWSCHLLSIDLELQL